jgi:hypothetical protein
MEDCRRLESQCLITVNQGQDNGRKHICSGLAEFINQVNGTNYSRASLPLQAWRDIQLLNDKDWSQHWEFLRPFFLKKGYNLFQMRGGGQLSVANGTPAPATNPYGLFGELDGGFKSQFQSVSWHLFAYESYI